MVALLLRSCAAPVQLSMSLHVQSTIVSLNIRHIDFYVLLAFLVNNLHCGLLCVHSIQKAAPEAIVGHSTFHLTLFVSTRPYNDVLLGNQTSKASHVNELLYIHLYLSRSTSIGRPGNCHSPVVAVMNVEVR